MPNYIGIQQKIDRGRGKASLRLGEPWTVYRLSTSSGATNYLDASNQIATNFPVFRRRTTKADLIEGDQKMGAIWFDVIADMTNFKVGDVFVLNDSVYGSGYTSAPYPEIEFNGMCLAYHAPVKKSLAARLDRLVQIFRPSPTDTTGYRNASTSNATPLQLASGVFVWGTVGATPAWVPIGLQSHSRMSGLLLDSMQGQTPAQRFTIYVPPLPFSPAPVTGMTGFRFKEGDRIATQDGAIYVVINPYEQQTGSVGHQLIVEREVAST